MHADLPPAWPPHYPRHRALTAQEAADIDELASVRHGLPSLVLMEHASRGVARIAEILGGPGASFLCLCGPGNNGGDGYGAARFLRSWGHRVEVLRCAPQAPRPGDARVQFERVLETHRVPDAHAAPALVLEALARRPTVVLDALLGVGLHRPLASPYREWVEQVNAAETLRLAVDVPSGLESDTGAELPICIQAHVTATMAAPKVGFTNAPEACGQVVEVDIGLPAALHEAYLAPR